MGILQFSSVLALSAHLEVASDPQTGPRPQLKTPVASAGGHLCFRQTGYGLEVPTPVSLALLLCWSSWEIQEHVTH